MSLIIPPATRPKIAAGYGIAQNPDGLLTWEWVSTRMEKSRNYWIATTRPTGNPHIAPVWGVWLENYLYFGGHPDARRTRNLRQNPNLIAHLESGDEVVILEGVMDEIMDLETKQKIGNASAQKYHLPELATPESLDGAIYVRVKPKVVLAWLEQDYPNTATRWEFTD